MAPMSWGERTESGEGFWHHQGGGETSVRVKQSLWQLGAAGEKWAKG